MNRAVRVLRVALGLLTVAGAVVVIARMWRAPATHPAPASVASPVEPISPVAVLGRRRRRRALALVAAVGLLVSGTSAAALAAGWFRRAPAPVEATMVQQTLTHTGTRAGVASKAPAARSVQQSPTVVHDAGRTIVLDTSITSRQRTQMRAVDRVGTARFAIPSIGLNVPLGAVNIVDGELTPPGIESAYWVRNFGVAPSRATKGTVYVVIHSVHDYAAAPGNRLMNIARGKPSVKVGALLIAGNRRYRVTRTAIIPKGQVPNRDDIWQPIAGRLVIITCLQRPDHRLPTTKNVVIWAQLIR